MVYNNRKQIYHQKANDSILILLLVMVSIYPLIVIPGPLPYFYGPRYILLIIVALSAAVILYQSCVKLKINLWLPMLIFFISILIATILSDNKLVAWGGSEFSYTGASTYLACGVLLILATQSINRLLVIKAMVITASIVSLVALMQHYGINIVPHEDYMAGYYSYSTIGHPNYLGTYTVFILPASIMMFLHLRKIQWLICSALIFGGLMASMTRGAWLAFAGIFCIFIYYAYKNQSLRKDLLIMFFTLISIMLLFNFSSSYLIAQRASTIQSDIRNAVSVVEVDYNNSMSIRVVIWKNALQTFANNWAFGIGPDNLRIEIRPGRIAATAFNFFLGIASMMGLFSLLAYLGIIYFSIQQNKGWVGKMLTFMIIAYLFQAQANVEIITNLPLFWIVLGLSWAKADITTAVGKMDPPSSSDCIHKPFKPLISILAVCILLFIFIVIIIFYYPRTGIIEKEGQGFYSGELIGLNTFHGYGVWEMENGAIYEGNFNNGLFHGYGILTYRNGGQYIGNFKEGYFHGEGKLTLPSGLTMEGKWNMGNLIEK